VFDDRELRCPSCRAFDWLRDGFAMREVTGEVVRERLAPSADLDRPWSCARCGYQVVDTSLLRRRLTEAAIAHVE
jgi:DNA-directed RNA polymerase subunit RPC12/RpoP